MNHVTQRLEPTAELLSLIEHRLGAIAIGHLALSYSMIWETPPEMSVYFDQKQVIEGKATGFTNGAIEAAIVHCRALLEFVGLAEGSTPTTLREISSRKKSDHAIENFSDLGRLSIAEAVAQYPGEKAEAEAALAYVIHAANKGLAHNTRSFTKSEAGTRLLEIAFRGVPVLIVNRFYIARGVEPPRYELFSRIRDAEKPLQG